MYWVYYMWLHKVFFSQNDSSCAMIADELSWCYNATECPPQILFSEIARDALHRTHRFTVIKGVISPVSDAYNKKVFYSLQKVYKIIYVSRKEYYNRLYACHFDI